MAAKSNSLRRRANKKQSENEQGPKKETGKASKQSRKRSKQQQNDDDSFSNISTLQKTLLVSLIIVSMGSVLILTSSKDQSPYHFDMTKPSSSEPKVKQPKESKAYDFIATDPDWDTSDSKLNQTFTFLKEYVCQYDNPEVESFCHPLLQPVPARRTHVVAQTHSHHSIERNEVVMVLPRTLQIWDLDALRDEWIAQNLFSATHGKTNNPIDSGAFLAAYLVRMKLIASMDWSSITQKDLDGVERFIDFLNILPTYDDYKSHGPHSHPVLWPEQEIHTLFGKLTPTSILIKGYRTMIDSEYMAFCAVSSDFKDHVSIQDYTAMRLSVISRSFGPGAPMKEEEMNGIHGFSTLDEELDYYKRALGIDLRKGCRAMSPILDMWNSHAKPNAEWKYSNRKRAFVISAIDRKGIPENQEIMVSYGKYTDTHMFAKFGYVNGDGSGHTEFSIAIMHPMLDVGMNQQFTYMMIDKDGKMTPPTFDKEAQKKAMAQYLRFDDGFEKCISKETPEAYKLKLLKLRHLQKIANSHDRWTVTLGPRNTTSKPGETSDVPITMESPKFDPKKVKLNGMKLIATCRLIALNNDDFDGKAIEVLERELKADDSSFMVPKQSDALEFRALIVMARLTTGALRLYPSDVQKDMASLESTTLEFMSKEWLATHVRLGEMQSLEVMRSIATSGARQMQSRAEETLPSSHPSLNIHKQICPEAYITQLLEDLDYM